VNDCRDLEVLVSLRASGAPDALDPSEAARLDAHLATCAACRAELDASQAALSLARLPAPSDAERHAVRDLPARTLAALHAKDRRRGLGRRALVAAAGVAVAAGLAAAVIAPALFKKTPSLQVSFAEAQPSETWQEPDLDTLWTDAQVVDFDASAQTDGDGTDAALAALEY
jgi:predicted anti-sigma-YlaC factor YlaD